MHNHLWRLNPVRGHALLGLDRFGFPGLSHFAPLRQKYLVCSLWLVALGAVLFPAKSVHAQPLKENAVVVYCQGQSPVEYDKAIVLLVSRSAKRIDRTMNATDYAKSMSQIVMGGGDAVGMVGNGSFVYPPGGDPENVHVLVAYNQAKKNEQGRVRIDLYLFGNLPALRIVGTATRDSQMGGEEMGMMGSGMMGMGSMDASQGEGELLMLRVQHAIAADSTVDAVDLPWDAQEQAIVWDSIRQHVWKRMLIELLNLERGVGPEADKISKVLREVLTEECATDAARRELELNAIAARLQQLRDEQSARQQQQDRIIDVQLNRFQLAAQGLLID